MIRYAWLLFLVWSCNSGAQTQANGQWKFPDSVRNMCVDIEQRLVTYFKAMIEENRKLSSLTAAEDRTRSLAISDSWKDTIVKTEESWSRLNCASILYNTDRKPSK